MGDFSKHYDVQTRPNVVDGDDGDDDATTKGDGQQGDLEHERQEDSGELWEHGFGSDSWQASKTTVRERTAHLFNNREMSDLDILACDENWWFGQTVKDYVGHKFVLASASPVFHKLLYEVPDEDAKPDAVRKIVFSPDLQVTLTLTPIYSGHRLEMDGIPPIAAEALLEYIYMDKFKASDFENGYSRNLLWRLWHASKAFEIRHLSELCSKTIDETMCEDTVFWDLNYSIQYKSLGVEDTMVKVLKLMESLDERLYEHPNLVWLDQLAVKEILDRRRANNCEPVTILNNLLRWSLYQVDRSACCEIDDKTNGDIPIEHRLDWIARCRAGHFAHVSPADLDKYLNRGIRQMAWTEMSQTDFLRFVVPNGLMSDDLLLRASIEIMTAVVKNPDRLTKSAFECERLSRLKAAETSPKPSETPSPKPAGSKIGSMLLQRGKREKMIGVKLTEHECEIVTKPTKLSSEQGCEMVTKPTSPA